MTCTHTESQLSDHLPTKKAAQTKEEKIWMCCVATWVQASIFKYGHTFSWCMHFLCSWCLLRRIDQDPWSPAAGNCMIMFSFFFFLHHWMLQKYIHMEPHKSQIDEAVQAHDSHTALVAVCSLLGLIQDCRCLVEADGQFCQTCNLKQSSVQPLKTVLLLLLYSRFLLSSPFESPGGPRAME